MAKIAISWNANLKDAGKKLVATRTFEDVVVNLFDTYEENLKFYGADFIQDSITGTSILVMIQNALRTNSLKLKVDDVSKYIGPKSFQYSDQEIRDFAASYRPEMNQAARERQALYDSMNKEGKALMDKQATADADNKALKKQIEAHKNMQKSGQVSQPSLVKNRKQS